MSSENVDMEVVPEEDYYFKVNVREGAPGWADDASYTSQPFNTFADVYVTLVFFNPRRYWRHLRRVQGMYIWKEGQPKVYVYEDGCAIDVKELPKLCVTEEDFDTIIASIDAKL